jgi:hypothetical protein
MKKATVRGFAKLGLLAVMMIVAAGVSAKAQTLDSRLTANIPFDFTVVDKKLPAGKYWVSRVQQSQGDTVLQVTSAEGKASAVRLTIPVNSHQPKDIGTLVFHRYGDDYFLSEVWAKGGSVGRSLLKTHAERKLERKAQDNQIAATRGPELETVTIRASN